MMKTKLLPLATLLLSGVRLPGQNYISFEMKVGPYDKYQDDQTVSYKLKNPFGASKEMYEVFRFGDKNNPNLQTVTKANHTISGFGTYEGTVVIPTKMFLGDEGMSVMVSLFNSGGSLIRDVSCFIYPRKKETINPTTYPGGVYTCPTTQAIFSGKTVDYTLEQYTFTAIDDYLISDTYYRLHFEQFRFFTTLKEEDVTYQKANIRIFGMQEFFPALTFHKDSATIPLEVNYNDNELTLSLYGHLYVEPKLLILSDTPKTGYRTTDNFYFPINQRKEMLGSSFTFSIQGIGLNQSTFSWQSTLLAGSSLIGDCQNSEYCVVGEVTK